MKKLTCEEAYKAGILQKDGMYYRRCMSGRKWLLFRRISAQYVYIFRGIDDDGRYIFDLVYQCTRIRICKANGCSICGKDKEFDFKAIKNLVIK